MEKENKRGKEEQEDEEGKKINKKRRFETSLPTVPSRVIKLRARD